MTKDDIADAIRKDWHEAGLYGRADLAPGWLDGLATVTADALLASPAMARLFAEVRAEAWDDGVRQAVSWLQADYPYGDMPDWRQSGVDWLLDRRLEHRTATNAHPTDDHAWEAK